MLRIWLPVVLIGAGYALAAPLAVCRYRRLSQAMEPLAKALIVVAGVVWLAYLGGAILDTLAMQ